MAASLPHCTMSEENQLSDSDEELQEHLAEVQILLARHKLVEDLVQRQEGRRNDLVEDIVHKQHLSELQRRLEPIQKRVAGGCHLTRDVRAELTAAGFALGPVDAFYQPGVPKPFGALSLGTARPA